MDEELVQNDVIDEKLVQNSVMNEKFVKNFVINAKIDQKVVMDLSTFKICGWNSLQPINQNLLEEFIDESEPWLLIGIPSRDPFLVTQYSERHLVSSDQNRVDTCVCFVSIWRIKIELESYFEEDMHRKFGREIG